MRGSEKSQQQFYGKQTIVDAPGTNESGEPSNLRPLTHDERNAISAKIIKAELKGNTVCTLVYYKLLCLRFRR